MYKDISFNLGYTTLAARQTQAIQPDAPHVLFLHGWLDNAASFDVLSSYLAAFNLTSLDLAGHGLSDHRPAGSFYHLWDYALDVIAVLDSFDQKVWLVGHSMGGAVAMMVAALAPDKIQGLVVLDSIGPATATSHDRVITMKRAVYKMLKQPSILNVKPKSKNELIQARMAGFTPLTFEAALCLTERGALLKGEGWLWRADPKLYFPSPYRMDEESVKAFIESISCPTLVLMANQGLFASDPIQVAKKANFNPCIKLKWLNGSHHFHLETETGQEVACEITHFIANS